MIHARTRCVRAAAAVAAGSCCLAAAACSGGGAAGPLAGVPAQHIAAEAVADAGAAPSLTMSGDVAESGTAYTIDIGARPGHGCTGTITVAGQGSFKLTVIGTTFYIDPDAAYWKANAGSGSAALMKLVGGRYIKGSTSDPVFSGETGLCDVSGLFQGDVSGPLAEGQVTVLDGARVLPLTSDGAGTVYVTDAGKPQLVEITAPKGAPDGSGTVTVRVGAPVTLAAPPASQVIAASRLGL